jgi:hypothetical protein
MMKKPLMAILLPSVASSYPDNFIAELQYSIRPDGT